MKKVLAILLALALAAAISVCAFAVDSPERVISADETAEAAPAAEDNDVAPADEAEDEDEGIEDVEVVAVPETEPAEGTGIADASDPVAAGEAAAEKVPEEKKAEVKAAVEAVAANARAVAAITIFFIFSSIYFYRNPVNTNLKSIYYNTPLSTKTLVIFF